jgi:hypothetical protein
MKDGREMGGWGDKEMGRKGKKVLTWGIFSPDLPISPNLSLPISLRSFFGPEDSHFNCGK